MNKQEERMFKALTKQVNILKREVIKLEAENEQLKKVINK